MASEIKVVMNVHNLNSEKEDLETFIATLKTLTLFATNLDLHNSLIKNIRNKKNKEIKLGLYLFKIIKLSYQNNNYELKFIIKVN